MDFTGTGSSSSPPKSKTDNFLLKMAPFLPISAIKDIVDHSQREDETVHTYGVSDDVDVEEDDEDDDEDDGGVKTMIPKGKAEVKPLLDERSSEVGMLQTSS